MPFAKEQPKDGDTILHCGHTGRGHAHWFRYSKPVKFQRPDGSWGTAEWFVTCEPCFIKHGDQVPVRGDGRWNGDEPAIMEDEPS